MSEPTKVTKVLVNKIHGGRKQDSKFWKSELSDEVITKPKLARPNISKLIFYPLVILALFILGYISYIVIMPLGFMATISNFFEKYQNNEKVIVKKVYVPRSNQNTKTPPVIKYSYIILLKNGKRIDAKSVKKYQGIVHLENNSGLIMKISSSEIDSIKKFKI